MRIFLTTVLFLLFSYPALAAHCVRDARTIDGALAKMTLTEEQKAEVERLKAEGLSLHENGDHRGAERVLAEAMRLMLDNVGRSIPAGMHPMQGGEMHNMEGGCGMAGNCCSGNMEQNCGMGGNMEGMDDM